ncbi:hypothetical protein ACFXAS_33540 [Streptomyces sp. NPDC059459]
MAEELEVPKVWIGPRSRALAERWHAHHQEHAVLGLLSAKENLRRPRV